MRFMLVAVRHTSSKLATFCMVSTLGEGLLTADMEGFRSGFVSYDRLSNELLYDGVSRFTSGHSKRVGRGDSSITTVEILLGL